MATKPKILVLKGQQDTTRQLVAELAEHHQVVLVDSLVRGLALLRHGGYAGVYVEADELSPLRRAAALLQADRVLDTMADGVALLDPDFNIVWANTPFAQWVDPDAVGADGVTGENLYKVLGSPTILGPDFCPLHSASDSGETSSSTLRTSGNRYLRVTASPVLDSRGALSHVISIIRDITLEYLHQQKIGAVHELATKLGDLDADELAEMPIQERTEALKADIIRSAREVLDYAHFSVRLLDPSTGRLEALVAEGLSDEAVGRELVASPQDNGIIGFVAHSGQSYLCEDTANDPLYLTGSPDARSAMAVPLTWQERVIGVLSVESPKPKAFDQDALVFLEIFARNISMALHTFELLSVEKATTATQWVERIRREAGMLINDIVSDAASALDTSAADAPGLQERLRRIQENARAAARTFLRADESIASVPGARAATRPRSARLKGRRVLVADADLQVRRSAYEFLSRVGCVVESAHNGTEAVAMAKSNAYAVVLADVRMPDKNGYEIFCELREHRPDMPVILMTAFGYDPTHTLVKCRAAGLRHVLFKPFRPEKLIQEVEREVADGRDA